MNSVLLIGRLTADPHVVYKGDMCIARFNLAIDRGKDKDGNKQADFPSCIAFGKTAELIDKYIAKGSQIGVQGRLQTGSYEKDGRTVYTTDVVLDRVEFLSKAEMKETKPEQTVMDGFLADDDIPFGGAI